MANKPVSRIIPDPLPEHADTLEELLEADPEPADEVAEQLPYELRLKGILAELEAMRASIHQITFVYEGEEE